MPANEMNKIWFELPKVETVEQAQAACELANKIMRKLGVKYDVFWATDQQSYCSTFYNANEGPGGAGFTELSDRGKWFNLAYLAE